MNRQKRRTTGRFTIGTIAVLGTMLVAVGTGDVAKAQDDVSGGQVSVKSPDGTRVLDAAVGLVLHLARAGGAVASFEPASPDRQQK